MKPVSAIYYGWANLILAALAMVATLPGRTQGLGLITEPLIADLGVDRITFANINLWATLIGALFCIPFGRMADRFGPRIAISVLVMLLGFTVLGMAGAAGVAVLAVTITLSRGFGQSALSVVSLALVGKWFARRLNFAMGVYALLVAVGFVIAFPSVGGAVLSAGWRKAWMGVGYALLVAYLPLAWLLVRNNPEQSGAVEGLDHEPGDLTLRQALLHPAFWVFAMASAVFGLVYSGIALFNQSILEQRGLDASVYHMTLVISTMAGLVANFGGGWLAMRWPIQRLMGLGMLVLALSLAILPHVNTQADVAGYAVAMGIAGGIVTVVFFSVWGKAFGRTELGRIQGAAQMATVIASAVGPLLLAQTLKSTGSYNPVFYGLAAVVVILGLAAWIVPMPVRRAVPPIEPAAAHSFEAK